MIIFEGPDNCGKSTAIKQMFYKIHELIKFSDSEGPPKTMEEWKERIYKPLLIPTQFTTRYVFDRFYFSELVYGKILRQGRTTPPQEDLDAIEQKLIEHDPLIIYCRRPLDRILSDFCNREQLSGVLENLPAICREYDRVLSSWRFCNLYVHNFEEPGSVQQLERRIREYIAKREKNPDILYS